MLDLIIHVATWVVICVISSLIVNRILKVGLRSFFRIPSIFQWKRSTTVWDHLDS